MAVKECQKKGGTAVWINAEPPFPYQTAMLLGVDLDSLVIINTKDYGEQILDIIRTLLFDVDTRMTSGLVDLIVIDSINCLIPKSMVSAKDDKGSDGDNQPGRRAAMLGKFLEELSGRGLLREGVVMIPIAQSRNTMNQYNPEGMSGGKALEFLSKVIVRINKGRWEGVDKRDGHQVNWSIEKNNVMGFQGAGEYQVYYGSGIDDAEKVFGQALERHIVVKSGKSDYKVHFEEPIDNVFKILCKLNDAEVNSETLSIYTKFGKTEATLDMCDGFVKVSGGINAVRSVLKNSYQTKELIKKSIESGFDPEGILSEPEDVGVDIDLI